MAPRACLPKLVQYDQMPTTIKCSGSRDILEIFEDLVFEEIYELHSPVI
jgi:hypothetical protein